MMISTKLGGPTLTPISRYLYAVFVSGYRLPSKRVAFRLCEMLQQIENIK